ncbi:maltooligosyl trehalose hydrolase [Nakamurella panacisegetis]|uniref:Malto-oligosyltrehalose trehalohydrolase n=1 Tax=Nakamurella panacisegetis TaxID=1090615 RepID=A0A1H0S0R1_9ACTN|nr:malto-oligosyltrehalose trehalohydrolase [Nakamurella panacisegetis]SDP35283.1 maltooligosyl trehalose hydrolase [Nakamurella panacisegetis]
MPQDFRVWAPRAARVDLVLQDQGAGTDIAMAGSDDGWWAARVETDDLVRYGFRLDGADDVRPDPRSLRQPDGVHGLSATFDRTAHRWQDSDWTGRQLAGGLIYELHIGTFTAEGTFDAAIGKLDHLVSLGVDFVELLPVNGFNGVHNWGYDGVLWYAVHEAYGGPAGYQRLVDACHQRGLAVIQDVVYNHLGPSGNYLPEYGPYLHEEHANTWGTSVNLDGPGSDTVREYIIDNALMWLRDYHVDGLRLDAVHALVDHRADHLLSEMAQQVKVLSAHVGRPLTLIAESDLNDPRLITSPEAGGYGLDAQWSDDFHHVLHVALTGEKTGYYRDFGSMGDIAKVLRRAFFHDGTYSSFRGRNHGREVEAHTTPASRFVVFAQDHDQIGNRAIGDRLSTQVDADSLALAATLVFTSPFTPMLFMGEEWAASTPWQFFTSHPEPDLGKATAEGRIAEFARMGWDPNEVPDPQDPKTFAASKLNWDESATGHHASVLELYRRLAGLRREYSDLTDPRLGRVLTRHDDDERWLVVERGGLRMVFNFADVSRSVPVGAARVLLATKSGVVLDAGQVFLPARTAVILDAV